jgi:hypothetical protein
VTEAEGLEILEEAALWTQEAAVALILEKRRVVRVVLG